MNGITITYLPESAWDKEATHTESGRYTGIGWLLIYAAHLEQHVDQINRTLEAWRAAAAAGAGDDGDLA